LTVTEFILVLPGFQAAVNASLAAGAPLPTTSVIINVLFDQDYTGHGSDPNGTSDASRTLARNVSLDGFGMTGLFEQPVGAQALSGGECAMCWGLGLGSCLTM
jgi:hypothetical protein